MLGRSMLNSKVEHSKNGTSTLTKSEKKIALSKIFAPKYYYNITHDNQSIESRVDLEITCRKVQFCVHLINIAL